MSSFRSSSSTIVLLLSTPDAPGLLRGRALWPAGLGSGQETDSWPCALGRQERSLGAHVLFCGGPRAPDDRQDVAGLATAQLLLRGLDVQPEQRLGVGGPDVEPPVGMLDR